MSFRRSQWIFFSMFTMCMITFGYTNCSPVHQNEGNGSFSSLGVCDEIFLEAFEKTFFSYSPTSTQSCSACHSSNYFINGDSESSWGVLTGTLGGKVNAVNKLFANAKGENPGHIGTPTGSVSDADIATVDSFRAEWEWADQNCGN